MSDCIHCLGTGHPQCRCGGTGLDDAPTQENPPSMPARAFSGDALIAWCRDFPVSAAIEIERLRQHRTILVLALEPLANLKIPFRPQGNAGAYSILFTDIEIARDAQKLAGAA